MRFNIRYTLCRYVCHIQSSTDYIRLPLNTWRSESYLSVTIIVYSRTSNNCIDMIPVLNRMLKSFEHYDSNAIALYSAFGILIERAAMPIR
ncbi:hypothetical protein D3C75_626390 [compost metagenome]